ncbi:phosphoadenosine phosphosulfate reductase family protein [Vallitalea guaymasensis]|uniref:phosphoadenosine phosphosulfate reductase domain-containing protein n=1 Tax=Vallitalea guaymasensis TaxID=1185412 RepID=UPI000DE3B081|nr:phosphoadenosine phosphosulfate reductase family protein [Vallitalea guaymasensis]
MLVSWFSAGVSSFIATYLIKDEVDKIIYCHIEDQHPDTLRYVTDCEKILCRKIEILKSPYGNVDNVQKQFRFINSAYGNKCTEILKKRVRKEWETGKKNLTYVWGFDFNERHRKEQTEESMPEVNHIFPLIDHQLTKQECHGMAAKLGVKRPKMYDLGYHNNNCIGCPKGGMGYWNKIRVDFPEVFEKRARREREIGHTCLKDANGPIYLEELDPNRGRFEEEIMEDCNIICQLKIHRL